MQIPDRPFQYDGSYQYLQETVKDAGSLRFLAKSILKDYGLIYPRLGLAPGDSLLDVGNGIGSLGHFMRLGGVKCFGIDINQEAVKQGRTIYKNERGNVSVVADAYALPFADGVFDAVVTEDVFEHFPTPLFAHEAFEEMERVLKAKQKIMFHKITVSEDSEHISADPSHSLKLTTEEWIRFFRFHHWSVIGSPVMKIPIINKTYFGAFFLSNDAV